MPLPTTPMMNVVTSVRLSRYRPYCTSMPWATNMSNTKEPTTCTTASTHANKFLYFTPKHKITAAMTKPISVQAMSIAPEENSIPTHGVPRLAKTSQTDPNPMITAEEHTMTRRAVSLPTSSSTPATSNGNRIRNPMRATLPPPFISLLAESDPANHVPPHKAERARTSGTDSTLPFHRSFPPQA